MLSRPLPPARLQNDMIRRTKHTMTKEPESLKSRLVTLALLAWVIFVNLAYYWHLAQAYGPRVLERLQLLLP